MNKALGPPCCLASQDPEIDDTGQDNAFARYVRLEQDVATIGMSKTSNFSCVNFRSSCSPLCCPGEKALCFTR